MDVRVYGETAKAVCFSATWEAFKADKDKGEKWRMAYFDLMSINNTYDVFYSMSITDYRIDKGVHSVRFYLVAKEAFAPNVREWLEDRFTEWNEFEDTIVIASLYNVEDMNGRVVKEMIGGIYEEG